MVAKVVINVFVLLLVTNYYSVVATNIETLIRTTADAVHGQDCKEHLMLFARDLSNGTLWATQMLESSATMPTGALIGSSFQLGNFDECLSVRRGDAIRGRYCLATVRIHHRGCPAEDSFWTKLQPPSSRMQRRREVVRWALCVPSSCSDVDVLRGARSLLSELLVTATDGSIKALVSLPPGSCQSTIDDNDNLADIQLDPSHLLGAFVVLYLGFLLCCTLVNSNKDSHSIDEESLWRSFDLKVHWNRLMSRKVSKDYIGCIKGLRVLTMMLVVFGHRGDAFTSGPLTNGDQVETIYEGVLDAMLMNGHLIVDTFFTLSGFLVSLNLFQYYRNSKSWNLINIYLYRYLRLTPAYLVMIAVYVFFLKDLSSGPLWKVKVDREVDNCVRNWWTNLLYVNNYVNPQRPCVEPSWYLACDMQLYLVSPFLVAAFLKFGSVVALVTLLPAVLVPAIVTYCYGLDPTFIPDPTTLGDNTSNATYVAVYVTTHCRAGPFLVGTFFAYLYHRWKLTQKTLPLTSWWVLVPSAVLSIAVVAVGWFFYQDGYTLSPLVAALYAGFHRTLFSWGIAIIVISCATGNGWFVDEILSWESFTVLSRLTYGIYLSHPLVQMFNYASMRAPVFMATDQVVWLSIGDYVLTVAVAVFLYLTVESPVLHIAKHVIKKRSETQPDVAAAVHPISMPNGIKQ